MTKHFFLGVNFCVVLLLSSAGCKTSGDDSKTPTSIEIKEHDGLTEGEEVTVVIALSSVIPGGVVGHCGIAVGESYWDFGPKRVDRLQPMQSLRSTAGPWWDDPEQRWSDDRTLTEVIDDLPNHVHPVGSLVAVVRVRVKDQQADAITAFWEDVYARMRNGEDDYNLIGRQCANMVGWSLEVGMHNAAPDTNRLPRNLRMMSPTRLYETLRDSLRHTTGPNQGEPAEVALWQLGADGFEPWQRPEAWDRLAVPELPRIRLAYERLKYLPADLLQ